MGMSCPDIVVQSIIFVLYRASSIPTGSYSKTLSRHCSHLKQWICFPDVAFARLLAPTLAMHRVHPDSPFMSKTPIVHTNPCLTGLHAQLCQRVYIVNPVTTK